MADMRLNKSFANTKNRDAEKHRSTKQHKTCFFSQEHNTSRKHKTKRESAWDDLHVVKMKNLRRHTHKTKQKSRENDETLSHPMTRARRES
jgi:hypothetical protein